MNKGRTTRVPSVTPEDSNPISTSLRKLAQPQPLPWPCSWLKILTRKSNLAYHPINGADSNRPRMTIAARV